MWDTGRNKLLCIDTHYYHECVHKFVIFQICYRMTHQSLSLGSDHIDTDEFFSLSQKSDLSQFRNEEGTDSEYEDEDQDVPLSDDLSSHEFSQVGQIKVIQIFESLFSSF